MLVTAVVLVVQVELVGRSGFVEGVVVVVVVGVVEVMGVLVVVEER